MTDLSSASVLLTGGAGFIGCNLLRRLVTEGARVRVLDNFATGSHENLAGVDGDVEVVEGDLRDADAVARACEGVQFVAHLGALGSVPRSVDNPLETHEVNVTGTLNVLQGARAAGVSRVVFASSSSVYGDTETLPKTESHVPAPVSPYGVSKLAAEQYCRAFWACYGLETVSLRYFNVFGPRQDPRSEYAAVIPKFISAGLAGEPLTVFGDGEQTRDFTFVENVLNANVAALTAKDAAGKVLNIAAGDRITVNQLATHVAEILGTSPRVVHDSERPGDIRHSYADVSQAKAVIAFSVAVDWKSGLEETVAWYREARRSSTF